METSEALTGFRNFFLKKEGETEICNSEEGHDKNNAGWSSKNLMASVSCVRWRAQLPGSDNYFSGKLLLSDKNSTWQKCG